MSATLVPYDLDDCWGLECQRCGTICTGRPRSYVPGAWDNGITSPEQAHRELGPGHVCNETSPMLNEAP